MRRFMSGRIVPWLMIAVAVSFFGCGSDDTTSSGGGSGTGGGSTTPPVVDQGGGGGSDSGDTGGGDTGGAAPSGWGNVVGKFVYDGTAPTPTALNITKDEDFCGQHNLVDESLVVGDDGGIANVVVYVRTKDVSVHPDVEAAMPADVTYDNKNCRFEPHILSVWVGHQTLVLHNSDPVGHNSNLQPIGDEGINPLLKADSQIEHTFNRKQSKPQQVSCNIHPWMKGYILPRDNPYVVISAADGSFKLENLPAGELEFQFWHEKAGYLVTTDWPKGRLKLTVDAGTKDLGTIKLGPALFEK